MEVSPVIRGACPDTAPTAIKSDISMDEQISTALAAVEAVCLRQAKILDIPERKERGLSDQRKSELRELAAKLLDLAKDEEPSDAKDEPPAAKPKTLTGIQLRQLQHRSKRK